MSCASHFLLNVLTSSAALLVWIQAKRRKVDLQMHQDGSHLLLFLEALFFG